MQTQTGAAFEKGAPKTPKTARLYMSGENLNTSQYTY
jgi:hypothetical protein